MHHFAGHVRSHSNSAFLGSTAANNASKHKHKGTGSNVFVAFWNFFIASCSRPTWCMA
jgi:hypothetical protein